MKFHPDRQIKRLALPLTRVCNRKCPECPARIRLGVLGQGQVPTDTHVPVSELLWAGKLIGPIDSIEVTGGEPTLHPDFKWISESFHHIFKCKDILLLTNGFEFDTKPEKLPLLLNYDRVYITWYTNEFAIRHHSEANTTQVNIVEDFCKRNGKPVHVQRMDSHIPFKPPVEGVNACMFGYNNATWPGDMVTYYRGQIYGCCTAWELDHPGRGILLTSDWRDHLKEIELPCESCFLGVKK